MVPRQLLLHRRFRALVDQEAHSGRLEVDRGELGIRESAAGDEEASAEVFRLEPFVLAEDLVRAGAVTKKVQDEVDGQASATDYRLAGHHVRIDGDALQKLSIRHGASVSSTSGSPPASDLSAPGSFAANSSRSVSFDVFPTVNQST
jgi:hypothetical protein